MSKPCQAQRLSPVLIVDAMPPALAFWRDRLGFQVTTEVPLESDPRQCGFAILENGPVEVMLQTRASVAGDIPALAQGEYRATLFLEVADVVAVERAVAGCEIAVPRRKTFYGADEIGVRVPGGHVVIFAQVSR
jgi:uncharacterized glyoxalase superfamily protein PhnB